MKIIDISLTISPDLPVWPGDPAVELQQVSLIDKGANANVSHLSAGVHIGTHVDAPHHFMNDQLTMEGLSLEVLTGPCFVAQFPDDVDAITAESLKTLSIPPQTTRILFRTRNSHLWAQGVKEFQEDFIAVQDDGAKWLVGKGFQLVGVDYLSVAPFGDSVPTHRTLLGAGVVVVEGLDLTDVPAGTYDLYCLPLKLLGSDGAPARAILIQK